jgi:hypothetical protein
VAALEGVTTLVSAVQGGPEVIIDGQAALLRAARRAGVRRFIGSDYSFNLFGLAEGDNINSDWRRAFSRLAEKERGPVQVVSILNGAFLDVGVLFGFLGAFDLAARKAHLWGAGEVPFEMTTYEDTARYTARAAVLREVPDRFEVAGDSLTFWQVLEVLDKHGGHRLEVVQHGSLEDLDRKIANLKDQAPHNVYAWLPLMYWRAMLNGKGRLHHRIDAKFPDIRPTSVAEYVAANIRKSSTS